MLCGKCGTTLKPGAGFCTACGTSAPATAPQTAPPPASIPSPPQANIPQPPTPPRNSQAAPRNTSPAGIPAPPPDATDTENSVWAKYQPPIQETAAQPPQKPPLNLSKIPPSIKAAAAVAIVALIAFAAILVHKANLPPAQPVSGVYTDTDYNISITFPPNSWNRMLTDPETLENDTLVFQRGDIVNPDETMKVFYTELPATASQVIPEAYINMLEKGFVSSAKKIFANEGYVYSHRAFAPYTIDKSNGVYLEGDGKRGDELPRVILFNAMHGRRSFYILFIIHAKDKEPVREETFDIINSLKFL